MSIGYWAHFVLEPGYQNTPPRRVAIGLKDSLNRAHLRCIDFGELQDEAPPKVARVARKRRSVAATGGAAPSETFHG